MFRFIGIILRLLLLLTLPFILLIRGAVYLHTSSGYLPWFCILFASLFTCLLIFIYLTYLNGLFIEGDDDISTYKRRLFISILVVALYGIHGIFYFSTNNLKTPELRTELRQVHPILRLSVSTLTTLDNSLVITDSNRKPEDYRKMGLKKPNHSLHYKQSTGYSHALDLRTYGRPVWKNFLIRTYFRIMGFRTLRHTGTADHLHVSLMSHDRPSAK